MAKEQILSDHDLIVEMHGDIQHLTEDVKEMKDNTKTNIQDHESRIRLLEKYLWIGFGILLFFQFAITIYVALHKSK